VVVVDVKKDSLEFVYDIKALVKIRVVLVNLNETGMKKMWEMMRSPSLGHLLPNCPFLIFLMELKSILPYNWMPRFPSNISFLFYLS
jgi:hypothetical protein